MSLLQEIQHLHDIQRDLEDAIFISDLDTIKECLEQGANPTDAFEDGDPKTCFTVACEKACDNGTIDILEAFRPHVNVSDMTSSLIACCGTNGSNTVHVCTWLLEHGADPTTEEDECLEELLMNDMETDKKNKILTQLVNHGLDLTQDERMISIWTIWAPMRAMSIIGELIKHGANPNACVNGITPLSLACHNGNHAMVKLLLAHGATNLGDFPGTAVVHNRFTSPDTKIMNLLREHGLM